MFKPALVFGLLLGAAVLCASPRAKADVMIDSSGGCTNGLGGQIPCGVETSPGVVIDSAGNCRNMMGQGIPCGVIRSSTAFTISACSGGTNDSVSINAAIALARAAAQSSVTVAASVNFPAQAKCGVSSTLNFTGFNKSNLTVNCNGAALYGTTAGAPVIDALGSIGITWNNCHIIGDATSEPTYGIQIGRVDITANDGGGAGMVFNHLYVIGSFTVAACYNFSGEGVSWYDPTCSNGDSGASYAFVQDGQNHFNITSAFVTENAPVDSSQSFEKNVVVNGHFKAIGGASAPSAVWVGGASGHTLQFYGLNTSGPACITLYNEAVVNNSGQNKNDVLDIHCEGNSLTDNIIVSGNVTTPVLYGLAVKEDTFFASNSMFKLGGSVTGASCQACSVSVHSVLSGQQATARMFDRPDLWSAFTGTVFTSLPAMWNEPNGWFGTVTLGANTWASPDRPGPLDFQGSATYAWGCSRKLGRAYTGAIANMRNGSSNATADVYSVTAPIDLSDIAGLLLTGATGNVVTCYDQSGGVNHETNATAANQPTVTLQVAALGARTAPQFGDAGALAMGSTSNPADPFLTGGYFISTFNQSVTPTQTDRLWVQANINLITAANRVMTLTQSAATTAGTWAPPAIANGAHILDFSYNSGNVANVPTIKVDGVTQSLTSTQPVGAISTDSGAVTVGNNLLTGGTRGWPGNIPEIIAWPTIPAINAQDAIRRNTAGFYGLTAVQ